MPALTPSRPVGVIDVLSAVHNGDRERMVAAMRQLSDTIAEAMSVLAEAAAEPSAVMPLLVSIEDAATVLSVGQSRIKQLCYDGTIESVKIGRRRLIPYEDLQRYTKQLVAKAS